MQKSATAASQRRTYAMLATNGIAHRDIAADLVAENAAAVADWAWQRQLRHYWREADGACHIAMGDSQIAYGWEYGASIARDPLLLLTYSEQCLLTGCMALRHDLLLSLVPARNDIGMPTQEYASALAHTFGRLLIVTECTMHMSGLQITRAMQV